MRAAKTTVRLGFVQFSASNFCLMLLWHVVFHVSTVHRISKKKKKKQTCRKTAEFFTLVKRGDQWPSQ
jgi:isoprenylcysteine carboxyl methyltransferase (ICMT) family protein YpbQ